MADLWDSCPMKDKPTQHYYDLMRPFESATYKLDLKMWNWLEKAKAELDKLEAIKTYCLNTLGTTEDFPNWMKPVRDEMEHILKILEGEG